MEILSEADKRKPANCAPSHRPDRFELYSVNPVQSYAPEEFIKADPISGRRKLPPARDGRKKGKK